MAKRRYINTRLWNDSFVADLDPVEKLLFVYLLTNEHTNLAGIYEIPLKVIATETGIEGVMVKKVISRLKDKVRYTKNHVVIRNHLKHQDLEVLNNMKNVTSDLKALDKKWLNELVSKKLYHIPEDLAQRLTIAIPKAAEYLNMNSNLNMNIKDSAEPEAPAPFDLKKEIDKLEEHSRRDMQIIGLYLSRKKPDIRTKEQLSSTIKRHLRAAKSLEPFDDDQILKGFRKASEFGEWTIETALKHLTK